MINTGKLSMDVSVRCGQIRVLSQFTGLNGIRVIRCGVHAANFTQSLEGGSGSGYPDAGFGGHVPPQYGNTRPNSTGRDRSIVSLESFFRLKTHPRTGRQPPTFHGLKLVAIDRAPPRGANKWGSGIDLRMGMCP